MKGKKKVGILTLSASDNCGSLLQAYALKSVIDRMHIGNVEVINFSTPQSHEVYDIFPKRIRKNRNKIRQRLRVIFRLVKEKSDYAFFRRKYIRMSLRKEILPKDLERQTQKYDVVVVGSDQVWNVRMADYDESFFAPQIRCNKVAYGPSLGGHDIRENSDWRKIVEYLKEFSAVSAREEKGKLCLEELLQKEIEVVLDPTLLLGSEEWKEIIGERIIKEEYIFYYSWAYNEDILNEIVSMEGMRLGYPVYVINASKWIGRDYKKWNFCLCKNGGPQAFLNLIYYSKKNFVQSLHGTIFAYIFKTDFWLLDIYEKYDDLDTRLRYLIEQLDVRDRLLTKYNIENIDLDKKPNYENNESVLEMKRKSYNYLKKIIEE